MPHDTGWEINSAVHNSTELATLVKSSLRTWLHRERMIALISLFCFPLGNVRAKGCTTRYPGWCKHHLVIRWRHLAEMLEFMASCISTYYTLRGQETLTNISMEICGCTV